MAYPTLLQTGVKTQVSLVVLDSQHYMVLQVILLWVKKSGFWEDMALGTETCFLFSLRLMGIFPPHWENPEITFLVASCGTCLFNCVEINPSFYFGGCNPLQLKMW